MTPADDLVFEFRRRGGVWQSTDVLRRRLRRKITAWAAMALAAGLILSAGALAGLYAARPQLDAQSQAFANESVAAIAPVWSEDALFARAASDFASTRSQAFDDDFQDLKRLGPGSAGGDCAGSAILNPASLWSPITATYACRIDLKTGPAVAVLSLRREAGAWKITGFYVSAARRPRAAARTN
jgi:hypothetical protein